MSSIRWMAEVFFLPYLGEVPAEMLQHHGLHQFTVTCHRYSIVASTIEEDSQFIGARMLDIQHSYIHTEITFADIGINLIARFAQVGGQMLASGLTISIRAISGSSGSVPFSA